MFLSEIGFCENKFLIITEVFFLTDFITVNSIKYLKPAQTQAAMLVMHFCISVNNPIMKMMMKCRTFTCNGEFLHGGRCTFTFLKDFNTSSSDVHPFYKTHCEVLLPSLSQVKQQLI